MKKLLVILSLCTIVSAKAANSDAYENELQRALARRRAALGESAPAASASSTRTAPVPTPRTARTAPVPAPRLARTAPVPAPRSVQQLPKRGEASGSAFRAVSKQKKTPPQLQPKPIQCAVCQDYCTHDDKMQLGCNHSFHKSCLVPWAQQKGQGVNCPLCRVALTQPEKRELGISETSLNMQNRTAVPVGMQDFSVIADLVRTHQARIQALNGVNQDRRLLGEYQDDIDNNLITLDTLRSIANSERYQEELSDIVDTLRSYAATLQRGGLLTGQQVSLVVRYVGEAVIKAMLEQGPEDTFVERALNYYEPVITELIRDGQLPDNTHVIIADMFLE